MDGNKLDVPTGSRPPGGEKKLPSEIVRGSRRVQLGPGYGVMDWVRLSKKVDEDLSGTGGLHNLNVTVDELRRHNRVDDAWIAIDGQVYNVTRYMKFHPGGVDELVRGIGTDATALFNETHQWVNYKSMLKACLVGPLVKRSLFKIATEKSDDNVQSLTIPGSES